MSLLLITAHMHGGPGRRQQPAEGGLCPSQRGHLQPKLSPPCSSACTASLLQASAPLVPGTAPKTICHLICIEEGCAGRAVLSSKGCAYLP